MFWCTCLQQPLVMACQFTDFTADSLFYGPFTLNVSINTAMILVILFLLKTMELIQNSVATAFWSDSIVFNQSIISSIIGGVMLTLSVNRPFRSLSLQTICDCRRTLAVQWYSHNMVTFNMNWHLNLCCDDWPFKTALCCSGFENYSVEHWMFEWNRAMCNVWNCVPWCV